jgi:hypothetical protein
MRSKGLDEFIEKMKKDEFIYRETGTNEFNRSTAAVVAAL